MTFKKNIMVFFVLSLTIFASVYIYLQFSFKETPKIEFVNDLSLIDNYLVSEAIPPIPTEVNLNLHKISIGEKLFHDPNLSADNTISCASCHNLSKGGTDNRKHSIGIKDRLGTINAPTIFNASFNFVQFWDGKAKTLKEQAVVPLFNRHEMGNTGWDKIIYYLNNDHEYQLLFQNVYQLPITSDSMLDALVEYEKSLITPNSRFDRYLKGDINALNTFELEGYQLFKNQGCISCHQGVNMGGNMFQQAGIFVPISNLTNQESLGRYNVTKDEKDKGYFKVPSLRNIALTSPYFHDGSVDNLEDAVKKMANAQLGIDFTDQQIQKVSAFLRTLTGEYKNQPL
jgi:cytochrome c peroxidase